MRQLRCRGALDSDGLGTPELTTDCGGEADALFWRIVPAVIGLIMI